MALATYIVHVHVTQKYGLMKLSYLHVHVHFCFNDAYHLKNMQPTKRGNV